MPYRNKTNKPTNEQPNKRTNIITIDGPAGSGKSTVARELAKRLGFLYIDTGAMYRALTLKVIKKRINLGDEEALARLARKTNIHLKKQGDALQVKLDGEDVTWAIRKQSLTEQVHYVAAVAGVREEMVKLQRKLAQKAKGAVLEGRDIGTVVFPDAKYKFYLDAKMSERIKRRYEELRQRGERVSVEDIAQDINRRDKSDMTRKVAPLLKAKDALYIDTTDLSVEEAVEQIIARCFI